MIAPAWITVIHPDPELAAARAGTVLQAFPGTAVRFTARGSDLVRRDRTVPTGLGAVLVHVDGVDRFHAGWCGHRVVARLADRGVKGVAWVSGGDRDGMALALRAGAAGVFAPCAHDDHDGGDRVPELRAAIRGALQDDVAPTLHACPNRAAPDTEADLARWFQARYGVPWQPWIEPAVAVIAAGGERTEQAEALRPSLSPSTTDQALRRLRQITEALCGEIRGNEAVLRGEALAVLRRIARVRPIEAEPFAIRSLQRASRLLQADPELATEAGLDGTAVRDLIDVATVELDAALWPIRRRGRPEAGAWRLRRDLALGRVAERRGSTGAEKIDELDRLAGGLDLTLDAIYDALEDRERPGGTGPRAAPGR